ncbi:MAG: DNA-directed RNA polymerase subunit beta [Acidobacteria bacterium]|nr:DNA-directed RNA polymerase subunit beta [Acidobacteriota bacterium]
MRKRRSFGTHPRRDFSKIPAFIEVPYLLGIQTSSYDRFLQKDVAQADRDNQGLQSVFHSVFPIHDFKGAATLEFVRYSIGEPKYLADDCRERGMTFSAPLKVTIRLVLHQKDAAGKKTVKDMKEQEVYFGELPLMTPTGTFIINGTERVVVSQMHKSPGVFFDSEKSKTGPVVKTLYAARMIPYRGSWLDFEFDAKDVLYARIDRRRKFLATTFLQAMGMARQEILDLFYRRETVTQTDAGVFTKKLDPELHQGHKLKRTIVHPKTKEVLVREGHKLSGSILKKLRASGVEEIPLAPEELLGQVAAREVAAPGGEVLLASNQVIDDAELAKIRDLKVGRLELLAIDGLHATSHLRDTLEMDAIRSPEEALVEIYKKMRPGEPPTLETSRVFFENLFFNAKRYDLSPVGRMKLNTKLNLQIPRDTRVLTRDDIVETVKRLVKINAGQGRADDVDHLGNRRVKSIGELLENQFRIGLVRMERAIKERMAVQEVETLMPHDLVNARPVDAAIKEFFGSSQLSQFMDQTNPLAEVTHKRRLSALGPGGLTRERAGFEVRDVHPTHYGRVCPIETPEGPNIGLITSLSTFARVNEYGFIETPYRIVKDSRVTDDVRFLNADEEDKHVIAQANTGLDATGKFTGQRLSARRGGDFVLSGPEEIQLMDVSPKQIVSVATALIPFLEHDDANRALMGSNMQRQAVPLLTSEAPLVGTGIEEIAARDSGVTVIAPFDGTIEKVDANRIVLRSEPERDDRAGKVASWNLVKYRRSNQNTCVNQVPIVREGQFVKQGDPLADGPATDRGELALGKNILVAFMPWGGYNFEDAIIVSERLLRDDVFTSVHIEEFEVEARDTKLGKEDITRDIPNVSEEALRNLDESGIVRIAAEVKPGDILVGKVTPKGETQLTPEEKLLRAIFGEKAGDVRDSSLVTPPGIEGTVVDVKVFSRRGTTKDERAKEIEDAEVARIKRELADEIRMVRDEEARSLVRLLEGLPAPKRLTGRKSKKVVCKAGEKMTAEVLLEADLSPLLGPKIFKDEKLRAAIERSAASAEERVHRLKADTEEKVSRLRKGDELPPGVIKLVKVYVAIKRKIAVGDKMAGRHGNKGVVSIIVPSEDMPYLPDGRPVDIVLNPLGVPSRMNVGQILEIHLGWAAKGLGERLADLAERAGAREAKELQLRLKDAFRHQAAQEVIDRMDRDELVAFGRTLRRGVHTATPVFDGATEEEIKGLLRDAGLPEAGKTVLYDGRTGRPFDQEVTVGYLYMLKLHHLVDDQIHARSIGPYSLVTQQPLGGKAQFGGQRFGEMEVWALEAYGAAYTLQEILTVKSDDVVGRTKVYESIVKGRNAHQAGLPESFNVLVKELQGLGLDVELME